MKLSFDRLVIDQEPKLILFTSEPYVVHMRTGFTVAADVLVSYKNMKSEKTLLISAQSLTDQLMTRISECNNLLTGVEVWIYKSGPEKISKYVVED
jgi:hypothetical protein